MRQYPLARDIRTGTVSTAVEAPAAVQAGERALSQTGWVAIAIFMLFSSLNFLDRQLLAASAPSIMAEFGMSNVAYGTLLAAFSTTYMLMAPLAGWFVDRVGLHVGAMLAIGTWSLAGAATGLTSTFRGLLGCRMALGLTEAAAIPCASKASAMYLPPSQQGFGIALQSIGITLGSMAAPLLVVALAPRYGWRGVFVACGLAGLAWIPLWWFAAGRIPAGARTASASAAPSLGHLFQDPRLWGILAANVLIMTVHSLWLNWTTVYFVQMHGLTQAQANGYFAWIPPIFATLGHLCGASVAARAGARGREPLLVRMRVCTRLTPLLLVTAAVPLMPTPLLAAGAISASFFAVMFILNNLHIMPIDLFGPERAALTSALLASSYAMVTMVTAPVMGAIADGYGFGVLCVVVSVLPMGATVVLRATVKLPARVTA